MRVLAVKYEKLKCCLCWLGLLFRRSSVCIL